MRRRLKQYSCCARTIESFDQFQRRLTGKRVTAAVTNVVEKLDDCFCDHILKPQQ